MKTKEERIVELLNSKGLTIREAFEEGAKYGYDMAMKWRDPDAELPKEGKEVQMKVFNGHDNRLQYIHDKYLGKNRWAYSSSKYIEIIGWRPIE